MNEAITQAKKALKQNEVPIGAIIVKNGKMVSKAHNQRERKQNALYHAEISAINKACKKLKSWRLNDCEMYVTLEPCCMCAGAILNARIKRVYIGCLDETNGATNSHYSILSDGTLNHKTEVVVDENKECKQILKEFFANIRKR